MKLSGKKIFLYLIGLSLLFLLTGCAAKQITDSDPVVRLVWPPAPAEAKIEWVKEYRVLEDTASRKGFWGKVGNFIFGPKTANMTRPYGICTDNGSRLFVADAGGSVIHVFDMEKESYQVIEGNEEIILQSPIGLTYVAGFLYISDSAQGVILRYDLEKESLQVWTPYHFGRPTGISFNEEAGLFYVSDTANHEIVVLDRLGIERFRFGGRGTAFGQFNFPTDLWVGAEGQVYVTDALNARIQVFSGNGEFLTSFGQPGDTPGTFSKPKGVAVDRYGHVFVCDALFDAVQIFDPSGQPLLSFGDNGPKPGQFWMPSGIFIDQQMRVFVADTYNRRVQVFKILIP